MRHALLLIVVTILGSAAAAQETRTYTDALNRTVEIPVEPQRIQSMYSGAVTPPLIELGAPVVGSQGTLGEDGTPYLRMIREVMKIDFDNSGIAFTHADTADVEVIAALDPDLIVGLVSNDAEQVDQLQRIAPTVLLDDAQPGLDLYRDIADVVGRLDAYEDLLADYRRLVADARGWLGGHAHTYSKLGARNGELYVYGNFGALTMALNDLGFDLVGDGVALRDRGSTWDGEAISAEALPRQDADFMFTTYRTDLGADASPVATLAAFDQVIPGFCALMTACSGGRLVVLPMEHAAISFRTLDANIYYIVTHVAGRPGMTPPE